MAPGADSASKPVAWHVGGADVDLRVPLLRQIREAGFDVGAVGTSSARPFEAAGIPFRTYDLKPGLDPFADFKARRQLSRLFREHQPTIVHAFDTKPCLLVPSALRSSAASKCVRTITGMGRLFVDDSLRTGLLRWIYRCAQRRVAGDVDVTVFQNEDDAGYFDRHGLLRGGRQALVRGSGVDVAGLLAAKPAADQIERLRQEIGAGSRFMVLMVTRLVATKGIREFLGAAATLGSSKAACVLVGPPDETDPDASKLVHEVEQHPDVIYLGMRKDVPRLLAAADLFVLPTYYREGLPRVLLEAAVMGLPIVSTPVIGCREVVHDGVTGLVVEPRSTDALVAAIERLMQDRALRQRLASAAKQHVVDHFSLERVARDYIALYRSVMQEA